MELPTYAVVIAVDIGLVVIVVEIAELFSISGSV